MKVRYLIPLMVVGLSLTLPVSVMGQERVDLSTLVKQGDQYLVPGSLDPYTGPFVSYRSPNLVKESGEMRDGYRHGPYESYYPNGVLESKESYSHGLLDGPYERFLPTGSLLIRGQYLDGKRDGLWEGYRDGQLLSGEYYSNGEPCGEWMIFDETRIHPPMIYPPCPNGIPEDGPFEE